MQLKSEIRTYMKDLRRQLPESFVNNSSCLIIENIINTFNFSNFKSICIYMSIMNEPRIEYICDKIQGKCICAPSIENDDIVLYEISDDFQIGKYGIREPQKSKRIEFDDVDIVMVPGIAFGIKGERVGFGKGYYDKFLSKTSAVKCGICYDFQLLDEIHSESHDIYMDYIITEKRVIKVN